MKIIQVGVVCAWMLAAMSVSPLRAAEAKLPISAFSKNPAYSNAAISPDGKYIGFTSYVGGRNEMASLLYFCDLDTGKISKVEPPDIDVTTTYRLNGATVSNRNVSGFTWVNNRRIVFSPDIVTGAMAVDRDGKHWEKLTGLSRFDGISTIFASEVVHTFGGASSQVLMLQRDLFTGGKYPQVMLIDTANGRQTLVATNDDQVSGWVIDQAGQVRVGVKWDGVKTSVIYREKNDASWQELPEFTSHGRGAHPLAFDYDGHTVYTAKLTPEGTWGLYSYDVAARKFGPLIFADKTYDIFNPNDFYSHAGLMFSKKKQKLVGLRYTTELSRTVWFDEEMQQIQQVLDQALPNVINTIVGWSDDESRILALSWSDRDWGAYYLLDRKTNSLRKIVERGNWIKPEQVPPTYPVKFTSRDGLPIHGYLTVPVGVQQPKNLPLVMYPHGGPWVRDVLEFDHLAKFLASRGYAVLQVNYRGSPGYGEAFSRAGVRQIGKSLQNDITDARAWAVRAGIADPKRVAIAGGSYGGYSVMWALTKTPELYRCGISLAGVSDWIDIIKGRDAKSDTHDVYLYWSENIGSLETDEAELREISPLYHVDRIQAPLFIIQGNLDQIVPPKQATMMINELKKQHKPYEEMWRGDEGHSFFGPKNRIEMFRRIEEFLDKNMK